MDADEIEQVIESEMALLTPRVRSSMAWVDALLDPDFCEIGASGRFWTRPEIISALAQVAADGEPIEAVQIEGSVVAPNLILLTYVSDPCGRPARRSSLWRRSHGGVWRLLHHQGTLLHDVWVCRPIAIRHTQYPSSPRTNPTHVGAIERLAYNMQGRGQHACSSKAYPIGRDNSTPCGPTRGGGHTARGRFVFFTGTTRA